MSGLNRSQRSHPFRIGVRVFLRRMHLIPRFKDISGPRTWGILSGIRETELAYLKRPLEDAGWQTTRVSRLHGWCCVEVRRGE